MASTPIADLSYSGYDGVLEQPTFRWWVISKMSMKLAVAKKGFWVWASISAYWYLVLGAVFYFMDILGAQSPLGPGHSLFDLIVWKDKFLDAFAISQLLLFIVALLIGTGTIANDNRANALLVYLSKPVTKLDYLLGKWMAIFLIITAIVAVPALLFYGYCYMSFRQYGFVSQDPTLFWKLLLIIPLPGILHASLCLGISSLFHQARLAGATYSAIYFLTMFFTVMMKMIILINWANSHGRHSHRPKVVVSDAPELLHSLFYCSVDGIQIGLAKVFLGTDGSALFPNPGGGPPIPHAPNGPVFGALYVTICVISIFVAWTQIRAVEVVRG